jgi:hypothetical protein
MKRWPSLLWILIQNRSSSPIQLALGKPLSTSGIKAIIENVAARSWSGLKSASDAAATVAIKPDEATRHAITDATQPDAPSFVVFISPPSVTAGYQRR